MNRRDCVMPKQYETVIGLEVHVELATKTKIFCGCSTAFGGAPNSHTCPVCMGMPGTLPVLNRQVVEYAMAVGLATNCQIMSYCAFDRKNYFYPDNPQNYQISQLYRPICRDGYVEISVGGDAGELESGQVRQIRIHEIHMEEDAGKLIHDEEGNSLVDYNRAGVPLIEIVTEPDMRSAEEVIAYLETLRTRIQYLGASDCKLQEGSMRADVNLSVRETGSKELGIRTEMKNLNSFHAIMDAIASERERQIQLLESGKAVIQETRRWDEDRGMSFAMRSKEDARDYRYFPEPDLAPVRIDEEWVERVRKSLPEFREAKMKRYKETYDIPDYDMELITESRTLAELFEETVFWGAPAKKVSNWIMTETLRLLRERNLDAADIVFSAKHLADLIDLTQRQVINSTVAKHVFEVMFETDTDPVAYVKEKGLGMVNDEEALLKTIEQVLKDNPKSIEDYYNGRERAVGFLVGQTMKATGGKADPTSVRRLLEQKLQR